MRKISGRGSQKGPPAPPRPRFPLLAPPWRTVGKPPQAHDHVAVKATRGFRFGAVKRYLADEFGLASHWSGTRENYASCVSHGYLPGPEKPTGELDPTPYVVGGGGSPDLAARTPIPPGTTQCRRTHCVSGP